MRVPITSPELSSLDGFDPRRASFALVLCERNTHFPLTPGSMGRIVLKRVARGAASRLSPANRASEHVTGREALVYLVFKACVLVRAGEKSSAKKREMVRAGNPL